MQHNYSAAYKNILLRPLEESDIEDLRIWRSQPENCKYLRNLGNITPQMQKAWFDSYLLNPDEFIFAIVETKELCRLIGSLSLYNFQGKQAEFGKILIGDPQAHGRKAGLHAVKAVLGIGFDVLGLDKIVLSVYEANKGAVHVYESAGFQVTEVPQTTDGKMELHMEVTSADFKRMVAAG